MAQVQFSTLMAGSCEGCGIEKSVENTRVVQIDKKFVKFGARCRDCESARNKANRLSESSSEVSEVQSEPNTSPRKRRGVSLSPQRGKKPKEEQIPVANKDKAPQKVKADRDEGEEQLRQLLREWEGEGMATANLSLLDDFRALSTLRQHNALAPDRYL